MNGVSVIRIGPRGFGVPAGLVLMARCPILLLSATCHPPQSSFSSFLSLSHSASPFRPTWLAISLFHLLPLPSHPRLSDRRLQIRPSMCRPPTCRRSTLKNVHGMPRRSWNRRCRRRRRDTSWSASKFGWVRWSRSARAVGYVTRSDARTKLAPSDSARRSAYSTRNVKPSNSGMPTRHAGASCLLRLRW